MESLALKEMAEKVNEMGSECSLDEYETALREIASVAQPQYEQEEAARPPWRRPGWRTKEN